MTQLIIQPDASAGIDTFLSASNVTTTYGTQTYWAVGSGTTSPPRFCTLAKFDLSAVDFEIASASLWLYRYQGLGTPNMAIHRILSGNSNWTETGACWNYRTGTTPWAGAAGCSTPGTDFAFNALWDGTHAAENGWREFPLDLAEFALMQAANYGIIMRSYSVTGGGAANPYNFYYCSDYTADATLRPKLIVTPKSSAAAGIYYREMMAR